MPFRYHSPGMVTRRLRRAAGDRDDRGGVVDQPGRVALVAVGQEMALSHSPPPLTWTGRRGTPLVMVVTASAMSEVS